MSAPHFAATLPAAAVLLLASVTACGGNGDTQGTGGLGTGGSTTSGALSTGGAAGDQVNGTGGATGSGGGSSVVDEATTQLLVETSYMCEYANVIINIAAEDDPGAALALHVEILESIIDTVGTTNVLSLETRDGERSELRWEGEHIGGAKYPAEGVLHYTGATGEERHICFSGYLTDFARIDDGSEHRPFVADTVFMADEAGVCSATPLAATVRGCFSDGYYIR